MQTNYHPSVAEVLQSRFVTNGEKDSIAQAVDALQARLNAFLLSDSLVVALVPDAADQRTNNTSPGSWPLPLAPGP